MIFVTVGTQLPFERLIKTIDVWAKENSIENIFAQIGNSSYHPYNINYKPFLTPEETYNKIYDSTLIISHAGMGTILTALELSKSIIVLPRKHSLGEHRNDHQIATCKKLKKLGLVHVAKDEDDLLFRLDDIESISTRQEIKQFADERLIQFVSRFIQST